MGCRLSRKLEGNKKIMSGNIFSNIPKQLNEEQFDELLKDKGINIERIVSKGHTSPKTGWYKQQQNEWVLVLKGSAIIKVKDAEQITLEEGDYYHLPAYTEHKVSWTKPNIETIWLAVHY